MSSNEFKFRHLFEPITLGKQVFRNRLFASPVSGRNIDAINRPDDNYIAFYTRKAMGGAASVCLGDCVVDSANGTFGEHMIRLDDPKEHTPMCRMAASISRYGAVASVELQHGGLYSKHSRAVGNTVYGPCHGFDAEGNEYLEMPEDVILKTIDAYARAAAFAKSCGFGMVTIHGGHGWLMSQFMSSKVNRRTDMWGGDKLENRMRFPLAVTDAIRRAVGPGFPIEIRISGSEVTEEGYGIEEGIEIAKALDGHVDLIHVSAGHHERPEVFTVTHPSIFMEDSCNAVYAAEVKKYVKTPVATVGAHCNPEIMEEIIASGRADVIEMARAIMADPDLPAKARRGKTEEIRPCLRCLACFSHLITNGQIHCAVNPEIGRERECIHVPVSPGNKTVLVAGGGIGGMEAAIEAAAKGHRVILCEKSGELGGALKCEKNVPFKTKIRDYIAYQIKHLEKSGAEIRLNTPVTPKLADELSPDVIIAALGAVPLMPDIPGIQGENVYTAEEIYKNPSAAGKTVAVMGGGLVGTELAIYLAGLGRKVTIIERLPMLNSGGNVLHQLALDKEIAQRKIDLHLGSDIIEILPGGVVFSKGGEDKMLQADTVVCALGQSPLKAEAWALRYCAPEFHVIGDCTVPKNIMQATAMANAAVNVI